MATTKLSDEALLAFLAARPELRDRFVSIVNAVEDADGDLKEADAAGIVVRTLDRSHLWSVQTPQVFTRSALERALAMPAELVAAATDEAWLIERGGGRVRVVAAPAENLKVPTVRDLRLAEQLLAARVD